MPQKPTKAAVSTGHRAALSEALQADWRARARPNQLPPAGSWRVWLLMSGRGFGKTECGAQWVRHLAESGEAGHIALIGQTAASTREVMVERILSIAPRWAMPVYESTRARLRWPNGCVALCYSADQPERLRGPQHAAAWIDELAAFRYADDIWSTLLLGLRIGKDPRICVTTTPRPTRLVRELVSREGKDVVITRGSTRENAANLAPAFLSELASRYQGTRLGRQELEGELLEDVPGALWNHELIDATRVETAPAQLQRIVIAVDPAGSVSSETADETGILVAGLGQDGHGYVLADYSGKYAPTDWARTAVRAYHTFRADKVVVERNFGGDMAAATIASVDAGVPVKTITSSRGKVLRAEPVSALYEQRKVHHVGELETLEDQACSFTTDWDRSRDGSPDRVDALVFALTELLLTEPPGGFIRTDALVPITAGGVQAPIEVPQILDGCFVSVAGGVGTEPDTIGLVFFGFNKHLDGVPLIILGWEILEISAGLLEALQPGIAKYFDELRGEIRFMGEMTGSNVGATLIEPGGVGGVLCEQAEAYGYDDVHALENEKILGMTIQQRAVAAAAHVASGRVQITREAHEQILEHKGVTRNHLLHQIAAFGVAGEQQQQAGALLYAFANGVLEAMNEAPQLRRGIQ